MASSSERDVKVIIETWYCPNRALTAYWFVMILAPDSSGLATMATASYSVISGST